MQKRLVTSSSALLSLSLALGACGTVAPPTDTGAASSEGSTSTDPPATTMPDEGTGNTSGATSQGTTAAEGTTTSVEDGPEPTGPDIKLDLGGIPDAPPPVCGGKGGGGGGGDLELSYIWIANSAQATISKIDTVTMVEEGRYQAKPFGGDPSRTSVNLEGDVAVANRNGGVAKFWAQEEDCQDNNGQAGIQTSSGPGDVLAWGEDDCLAWYTELACSSNRPVAWTRGTFNEAECAYEGMQVWTVCDSNILLLNGETGAIDEMLAVPGGGGGWSFVYGGAADADGNFWGLDTGNSQLFRVDFETLDIQSWPLGPGGGYGITIDSVGRPWTCGGGGVSRFNIDSATWDSTGGGGIGGCMTDGDQLIWHSNPGGTLLGFNIETLDVDEQVQLPEYVHGVSVDFQGKVWGVGFANNNCYRADPITDDVDAYNGLFGAYTYSDMTGFALSTAGGGGMPPG
jgi:hypothetical protein